MYHEPQLTGDGQTALVLQSRIFQILTLGEALEKLCQYPSTLLLTWLILHGWSTANVVQLVLITGACVSVGVALAGFAVARLNEHNPQLVAILGMGILPPPVLRCISLVHTCPLPAALTLTLPAFRCLIMVTSLDTWPAFAVSVLVISYVLDEVKGSARGLMLMQASISPAPDLPAPRTLTLVVKFPKPECETIPSPVTLGVFHRQFGHNRDVKGGAELESVTCIISYNANEAQLVRELRKRAGDG